MPSRVRSQLKHVKTLTLQVHPIKHWVFVVEEGDELTEEQRAKVRPGDTLAIREIPKGFLSV